MLQPCRQFLIDRLQALTLSDGFTKPFTATEPGRTIYFKELPADFLKDNDYAVAALPLVDRNRKNGRLIGKSRNLDAVTQTLIRRRFDREILFRVFIYAPTDELWGTEAFTGLVEQFGQAVAGYHHILDDDDSVILIEPQDIAQPWNRDAETGRRLDRPPLSIVRVQFNGGIQTQRTDALIPSVEIIPQQL